MPFCFIFDFNIIAPKTLNSNSVVMIWSNYKNENNEEKRKMLRKYYKIINIIMEGKNSHRLILTEKAFC